MLALHPDWAGMDWEKKLLDEGLAMTRGEKEYVLDCELALPSNPSDDWISLKKEGKWWMRSYSDARLWQSQIITIYCSHCFAEVTPRNIRNDAKYMFCSPDCHTAFWNDKTTAQRTPYVPSDATCIQCAGVFIPKPKDAYRKFCSPKCCQRNYYLYRRTGTLQTKAQMPLSL